MTLIVVAAMSVGCLAFPSWTSFSSTPSVADLSRCGANPSSLCLVSFGLDDNNRMRISFFIPDVPATSYYLKVQYNEETILFACQLLKEFPNALFCSGDPQPLGASVSLEIYLASTNVLLARGPFVIDSLAIPTFPVTARESGTPEFTLPEVSTPTLTHIATVFATIPARTPISTPTPRGGNPYP